MSDFEWIADGVFAGVQVGLGFLVAIITRRSFPDLKDGCLNLMTVASICARLIFLAGVASLIAFRICGGGVASWLICYLAVAVAAFFHFHVRGVESDA